MKSQMFVCLALLALASFSGAYAGVEASLELQKSIDLDVPAGQLSNNGPVIMNMAAANPSAPPTAEPQVLLSLPQVSVDLDITKQKVPLLSVADAPCKKLCKNKCDIKMEKSCINVTLPKKDCKVGSKTITKKFCEKKCKPSLELQLPAFKLPKLPTVVPPANPNPSAPPAANPSAPPAALVQADDASEDGSSSSSSSALSALQGLIADKLPHADLDVACRDVCVEVPIVLPELECSESSKVVEKCTFVPEKTCKEECICLPQKSLSLNLPKKPTLSVSASIDSKVVG